MGHRGVAKRQLDKTLPPKMPFLNRGLDVALVAFDSLDAVFGNRLVAGQRLQIRVDPLVKKQRVVRQSRARHLRQQLVGVLS